MVATDDKGISLKNPDNLSVTIDQGASITSSDDAIHAGNATTGTVSITNSGSIESTTDGQAIDLNDITGTANQTTITNTATGVIKADNDDGIRPGTNATVVNSGTIYSDGAVGDKHDGIDFQEAPTGTVINQSGGLISGERHGITTDGYVDVYNAAGATIIGRNGSGVGSDGTGKVVNHGTIIGGYNGSGTGDGDGVDIDGAAYVDNWGTIRAEGAAGLDKNGETNVSEGLALTGGGTVINEQGALITSVQNGATICCSSNAFTFQNYGTVHGDNAGLAVGSLVSVYNYGTITGGVAAIASWPVTTSNISVYNYGTISSANDAIFNNTGYNTSIYMAAGSTIKGNMENYGSLDFNVDSTYTIDNNLKGSGNITKSGDGDLILTGNSGSSLTGATDILAGTLTVDGSIASSAITARSNTMLNGSGTVGSTIIEDNATLMAGTADKAGTLKVQGNLQQQAGSSYIVNGGHVAVAGQAQIGSNTQLVMASTAGIANGFRKSDEAGTYRVLTASQGLNGNYTTLVGDTQISAFDVVTEGADANDVYLHLDQVRSFADVAHTRNESAVAHALDTMTAGAMKDDVGLVGNNAQARQAFNATSGEIHASARTELIQDSFYVRNAAIDRLRGAACDPGAGTQSTATMQGRRTDGTCQSEGAALWGEAYGGWGHNSGDGNAGSMHHSVGGFVLGADTTAFNTWRIGGLVSYGHSGFDVGSRSSSGHSNNVSVGGYAGTHWGHLALRLGATYSWNMLGINRQVMFAGYSGRENSSYLGGTAQGFGDLGYRFNVGPVALEPFGNVAYVNLHTNGFNEHGGKAALAGRATDTGTTYSTFGLRMSSDIRMGSLVLIPNASLAYRHTFGHLTPTTQEYFARGNGPAFDVAGVPLSENAAVLDAGLKARMTNRVNIGVSYIGQYGERSTDSGIRGKFDLKF
ncbi:autotransporter domain-containing protein [Komagataeibacter sp. FXV3]|uniref:autotransporter domain-containing protein n=1 Tax=Komagataeibacter sp. FXV3 TaxID=2608998 RepID=UPI00187B2413